MQTQRYVTLPLLWWLTVTSPLPALLIPSLSKRSNLLTLCLHLCQSCCDIVMFGFTYIIYAWIDVCVVFLMYTCLYCRCYFVKMACQKPQGLVRLSQTCPPSTWRRSQTLMRYVKSVLRANSSSRVLSVVIYYRREARAITVYRSQQPMGWHSIFVIFLISPIFITAILNVCTCMYVLKFVYMYVCTWPITIHI